MIKPYSISLASVDHTTPFNEAPAWSKSAIWYQIFTERFYNGDQTNDPKPANINIPSLNENAPSDWTISRWTGNWYDQQGWEGGKPFNEVINFRRYGGDLQGVLSKLDYLQDLGVTALYMNPLNDASSSHKFDARNYHHIDVNFGPDPEGDIKIIASENPDDPSSWQWTAADKLFLSLIESVHTRGMKIIMDYSWNHTGVMFWAWQDILKNREKSAFKDWYDIRSFGDPDKSEIEYSCWMGVKGLPELRKVNIMGDRSPGKPYEGDLDEGIKQHIMAVTNRWLAPEGNPLLGIDGFRLDVADHIGMDFWRDFRKRVRQIKPDAYLVGEVWWDEFPEKFMDPAPFIQGDVFDAIMFYHAYRPARYFFSKSPFSIDAAEFKDSLEYLWDNLGKDKCYAMMNVSSTHDSPRLLTDFFNSNRYKLKATPMEDPHYLTGKPDDEIYSRVQMYLVHLFTTIGAPHIWNGEEMGMWGADDPDQRKPLWWDEFCFEDESRYNFQPGEKQYDQVGFNEAQFEYYKKLISIRKTNPVLVSGDIKFLTATGGQLVYQRYDKQNEILVLFNNQDLVQNFNLPADSVYINLLGDEMEIRKELHLDPLKAAILKAVSKEI